LKQGIIAESVFQAITHDLIVFPKKAAA